MDILFIERGHDELNDRFFPSLVEWAGRYRLHRLSVKRATSSFWLHQRDYRAAIFDCLRVEPAEAAMIAKISRLSNGLPILVTARHIELDAYRALDRNPNIRTLQRYFNVEVFRAVLKKATARRDLVPRASTRFRACEDVRLLFGDSEHAAPGRVLNYSASGMFLEWRGAHGSPGDLVRVSLPLSWDDKTSAFAPPLSARVVWRGPRGAGVQII